MSRIGEVYRHYNGDHYCIQGHGLMHDYGTKMVVYRSFDIVNNRCEGPTLIRSEADFDSYLNSLEQSVFDSRADHVRRFTYMFNEDDRESD